MSNVMDLFTRARDREFAFFGDAPVVYHCNHFNLFLDQTVDDALGSGMGVEVRTRAAREAAYELLSALCEGVGAVTPKERLELAQQVFSAMGHGKLQIDGNAGSGTAGGSHLHYGFCWSEKYGDSVRRRHPADAFGAGFAAAALEVARGLPSGALSATEWECVAMRAESCKFEIREAELERPGEPIVSANSLNVGGIVAPGVNEATVGAIADGLVDFLGTVQADERGLVQAFGVFVTVHLASYYNKISYDTYAEVLRRSEAMRDVATGLFRESGHVCVFNTFGGIMLSPEWEGLVGAPKNDPAEIVTSCTAIARSLGFGKWSIAEFEPNKRLVLRSPSTYETPFARARIEPTRHPTSFFMQGAAVAFMQLAHRVDWAAKPRLTKDVYANLFRGGEPWTVTQTKDSAGGDEVCEVVVEAKG